MMHYFDIIEMHDSISEDFASRLGFKKVFNAGSSGVSIANSVQQGNKIIINPETEAVAKKAARSKNVVAFYASRNYNNKILRELSDEGKTIIFSARDIIFSGQPVQKIVWNSDLLKRALHYSVNVALASFARSASEMRSAQQLIEIAKMLGASDTLSKAMLNANGGIYDIKKKI
ncbi:MAG: hypothetical protein QXT36_02375 [Candidatus Micrarchaeaceae archaeon]